MLCSPAFAAHARSTLYNFVSTVHSFIKVHEVFRDRSFKKHYNMYLFGCFNNKVTEIYFNTNMLSVLGKIQVICTRYTPSYLFVLQGVYTFLSTNWYIIIIPIVFFRTISIAKFQHTCHLHSFYTTAIYTLFRRIKKRF